MISISVVCTIVKIVYFRYLDISISTSVTKSDQWRWILSRSAVGGRGSGDVARFVTLYSCLQRCEDVNRRAEVVRATARTYKQHETIDQRRVCTSVRFVLFCVLSRRQVHGLWWVYIYIYIYAYFAKFYTQYSQEVSVVYFIDHPNFRSLKL